MDSATGLLLDHYFGNGYFNINADRGDVRLCSQNLSHHERSVLHLCQTGPTINKLEIGDATDDKLSTQNSLYLKAEAFTNLHNPIQNAK